MAMKNMWEWAAPKQKESALSEGGPGSGRKKGGGSGGKKKPEKKDNMSIARDANNKLADLLGKREELKQKIVDKLYKDPKSAGFSHEDITNYAYKTVDNQNPELAKQIKQLDDTVTKHLDLSKKGKK